jgi:hypothetical protein
MSGVRRSWLAWTDFRLLDFKKLWKKFEGKDHTPVKCGGVGPPGYRREYGIERPSSWYARPGRFLLDFSGFAPTLGH